MTTLFHRAALSAAAMALGMLVLQAPAAPLQRATVDPELPSYIPPRGAEVGGQVVIEVGEGLRPVAEALAEGFEARAPGISARVAPAGGQGRGGSSAGDPGTARVRLGLGPSPEPDVEASRNRRGFVEARVTVAREAIIPIVQSGSPLARRGLSLAELDGLYSARRKRDAGRIRRWAELDLAQAPALAVEIVPLAPREESGLAQALRRRVLLGAEVADDVRRPDGPAAMVEAVSGNADAIGVTIRRGLDERVAPVPVRRGRQPGEAPPHYLPTSRNVESLRYPLIIAVNLYVDYQRISGDDPQAQLLEFLRFALSREGQAVVASAGHYPLGIGQIEQQLFDLGVRLMRPARPDWPVAEPVSQ